jgi:hypothetical protein
VAAETEVQEIILSNLRSPAATPHQPLPAFELGAFTGGVWNRWPKAGTGFGATPYAFEAGTAITAPRMKNTITVLDGGENPAPGGAPRDAYQGFPMVYGWAHAGDDGKAALGVLGDRLRAMFRRGSSFDLTSGAGVELVTLERQPLRDADEFGWPGMIFTVWRVQATYVRAPAV